MSSIERTLKKVLKPPRTRSRTEVLSQPENTSEECPGTTANLAPVEAAEPVTGLASEESGDAGNTGSISAMGKLYLGFSFVVFQNIFLTSVMFETNKKLVKTCFCLTF